MDSVLCLSVSKDRGEKARKILKILELFNENWKIESDGVRLYVPLIRKPSSEEDMKISEEIGQYGMVNRSLKARTKKKPRNLKEFLTNKLTPSQLELLPRAFDTIGNIAVIEIPTELESAKRKIGEALISVNKNVSSVFAKAGIIEGRHRTRALEHVAGANKTETIYHEHGCVYRLDISKVYFSPRLSTERGRIAAQIESKETVLDMFAGVGPFSVLIAKTKGANVYAIDINPHAMHYLRQNILMNRVNNLVVAILGEARRIVEKDYRGMVDRVIMNLPEGASQYLDVACLATKPSGGTIHYYEFRSSDTPVEEAMAEMSNKIEAHGRKLESISGRKIKESAPFKWHVGLDIKIK
ncbi:MAG: class I SAM-dependent methyltransferase family protein [Candidatus Hodarchaeota archaeon]